MYNGIERMDHLRTIEFTMEFVRNAGSGRTNINPSTLTNTIIAVLQSMRGRTDTSCERRPSTSILSDDCRRRGLRHTIMTVCWPKKEGSYQFGNPGETWEDTSQTIVNNLCIIDTPVPEEIGPRSLCHRVEIWLIYLLTYCRILVQPNKTTVR